MPGRQAVPRRGAPRQQNDSFTRSSVSPALPFSPDPVRPQCDPDSEGVESLPTTQLRNHQTSRFAPPAAAGPRVAAAPLPCHPAIL